MASYFPFSFYCTHIRTFLRYQVFNSILSLKITGIHRNHYKLHLDTTSSFTRQDGDSKPLLDHQKGLSTPLV